MDRLSMSLDDLIAQKEQGKNSSNNRKNERRTSGNGNRNNKNGNEVNNKPKVNFGAAKRQNNDPSRDDRRSEPYVRREIEVKQPLTYRPVKILGSDGNRNQASAPSSASVFARLGSAPAASGTCVLFNNLKKTVDGSDLQELCSAVGELKEVEKSFGSAKVWFSRRSDAVTCVAKFNGLTLDGLVMSVTLANEPPPAPKSVFDRLKPAGPKNVKEGIFGVSIDDDEDDQQVDTGRGRGGPKFQVTLSGADRSFDRREQRSERPTSSNGHRQVTEEGNRRQTTTFKVGGGRGAGARRNGGGARGGERAERAPKKDVNLDDDLDAYMSSR